MPITFLRLLLITMSMVIFISTLPFTLMLDPAGDTQYTGRLIEDSFERGLTLQCAEAMQALIHKRFPGVRVVFTRFPGETQQLLQNANFANRLDVDLYLSILFYPESKPKSQLFLYYFSNQDAFIAPPSAYALYPYDKAHLFSLKSTKEIATAIGRILGNKEYSSLFTVHGVYTLPIAPLIGIKKPAITIEVGLKNKDEWKLFIDPIVTSIAPFFENTL